MKVLLIDNYDSFTYNLYHYVKYFSNDILVVRNDRIERSDIELCDKILISPGPGLPSEAGQCESLIREYSSIKSILGICLGHQAIATAFGGKLLNLSGVIHGKARDTFLLPEALNNYLFQNILSPFLCARYHSWVIDENNLPDCLEILARDKEGYIMAVAHKQYDIHGLQFHPESILSPKGINLIRNWLTYPNHV